MTESEAERERGLLPEIAREIDQVAHFGHAPAVKRLVKEAGAALEEENWSGAVDPLTEAKGKAPRSAHVREMLGLAYYGLGRWREAARELAAYRRLSGGRNRDPEYADAERALGRPEKAVEILADLDPDEVSEDVRAEALVVRAGALCDLGRAEEAVALLETASVRPREVLPYHLRMWYALADALERAGRRTDARWWWDAIYAEEPEFFDVARRRLGLKTS
jgi:tetratricopeptide (TPR) repeat protein